MTRFTEKKTEALRGYARTWNTRCFASEVEILPEWTQVPRVPSRQRMSFPGHLSGEACSILERKVLNAPASQHRNRRF